MVTNLSIRSSDSFANLRNLMLAFSVSSVSRQNNKTKLKLNFVLFRLFLILMFDFNQINVRWRRNTSLYPRRLHLLTFLTNISKVPSSDIISSASASTVHWALARCDPSSKRSAKARVPMSSAIRTPVCRTPSADMTRPRK